MNRFVQEKPKTDRPSVPIIEERESDNDNDRTISPISDQPKHTPIKIDFVKPVECVECGENEKQAEKPTSFTQNPKEVKLEHHHALIHSKIVDLEHHNAFLRSKLGESERLDGIVPGLFGTSVRFTQKSYQVMEKSLINLSKSKREKWHMVIAPTEGMDTARITRKEQKTGQ
nr:hypothetical protein [Tanacetum cinerariifolium]